MDDIEVNLTKDINNELLAYDEMPQDESSTSELTSEFECLDITIHPAVELPLPFGIDLKQTDMIFLDPSIGEGKRLVRDKETTAPQLFAVARQFINPVCGNIGVIVDEMIQRGVQLNDIDESTGMSILHYTIRAAAMAEKHALSVVKRLLGRGADPSQRSIYTDMNALHLAAYFDIPAAVGLLLKSSDSWPPVAVDSLCSSFEYGTSLHIAATCLSCCASEVLLQRGACTTSKDDLGRTPEDCIPSNLTTKDEKMKANHIRELLQRYGKAKTNAKRESRKEAKLTIGSRVKVTLEKTPSNKTSNTLCGTLRYLGSMSNPSSQWAGVELETPEGKNDGSVGGKSYFSCKRNHGLFVPASCVVVACDNKNCETSKNKLVSKERHKTDGDCDLMVGERVVVAGKQLGTLRFLGTTQFASGTWCGVEMDKRGSCRNDGSIGGVRYFTCDQSKGIFAPPSKLRREIVESDATENDVATEIMHTPDPSPVSTPRDRRSGSLERINQRSTNKTSKSAPSTPHMERRRPARSNTLGTSRKKSIFLKPDMQVELRSNQQVATVKFIGATEFAAGLWLGLDLCAPVGKNDGSVKGKRYFTCPPKHGVMIRPSLVTRNGINGNLLIPPHLISLKGETK